MAISLGVTAQYQAIGDGTSTSFGVNLVDVPLVVNGLPYKYKTTNSPTAVGFISGPAGTTASVSGNILTFTFPSAPAANSLFTVSSILSFNGLL